MKIKANGNFSVLRKYPIASWDWPKIVVYIPWPSALSYTDEVMPHFLEIARTGVPFLHLSYGAIDRMRNVAGKQFRESDYTHILMLDADHTHDLNIVQRMAAHVLEDRDRLIVAGLNFRRTEPFEPCVSVIKAGDYYRPHEWDQGIAEVDLTGTGAILIAKQVFDMVEWPWFVNEPQYETTTLGTDDNHFCKKAKAAGIKVWVDFTLTSPHMTSHRVTEQTYRSYCKRETIPEKELINA